jgi:hypothetical protein
MLKRLLLFLMILVLFFGLSASEPTMAVLPAQGRGPDARLAEKLSEELKLIYRTIRGAISVDPEKVMPPALLKDFEKCGTNRRCVEQLSSNVRKSDLVLFPLIRTRRDKTKTVNLYIYSNQGRQVMRYVVKVEPGSDEEDIAADVGAALMTVSSDIASAPGSSSDDDDDDEEPAVARSEDRDRGRDREAPSSGTRMSSFEARTTIRNGFKAYKSGDVETAIKLFSEAGDSKLAQEAEDVTVLIERSVNMIQDGEAGRAIDSLKRAEKIDDSIRERGYKELQFIREMTRRDKYNEPKEADYRNVDALFRDIRKEISEVADWRRKEIEKAENSISDQLREREKITRDFERNEEKKRGEDRNEERDHKKKIEDLKSDLTGLDSKYRQKLMGLEKEITLLNRRLDDQRPAEEKFRREIEKELKDLDGKRRKFEVQLRRELGLTKKKARYTEIKEDKDAQAAFRKMEESIKLLDAKLASITKEIEKANIDFDRNEQRENQIFERSMEKAQAQDRKDIEDVEKINAKEVAAFNREIEDYDKKIGEAAKKIDQIERETTTYIQKQDERIQKSQELANKKREELERRFDGQRRAAENKAEEEYRRGQSERARKIESLEKQILNIEEKDPKYDKNPRWVSSRKELRSAMDDLVKYEENHVKFVEDKMAPALKAHEGNIKKLEASFARLENTVKKEIAAFTRTKNQEKAAAEKALKALESGKGRFEAQIRKKIENSNNVRDRKIKEIEARAGKREAERVSSAQKRRAVFEKQLAAKRNEFAATEKQIAAVSANAEKLRIDSAKKIEQLKINNSKMLSDLEIAQEKKREAQEIAFEKERIAIYEKYEKKAENEKKEILVKIDQIEKGMRDLLAQRGKEEVALRSQIENAEKQTDVMYKRWENEAKQRRAQLEKDLAAAERRENAAKAKLESQKKNIENQYNSKVEAIIKAASRKVSGSDKFTTERNRTYEFSAQTKKIYNLVADALSTIGNEKLEKGYVAGARRDFYEAIYFEKDNKSASDGLKAVNKKIEEMYDQADKLIKEDPQTARRMLLDLRKQIEPDNSYYLKTLALLEELRQ